MTDNSTDTKNKVLDVARILFAKQGFEGTSVRDIAKEAEVNVASINYHFNNKENLFSEILRIGYTECSTELRSFYDCEQPKLEDLLLHLFRYFIKSHDLLAYFKMMMSAQHSHHMVSANTEDGEMGPPGAKVIVESILKEVDNKLSQEDLHWALKTLFSHIVHTSIMFNCCFKESKIPFTSLPDLEKNIQRLTRVVLLELRNSSTNC